MVAIEIPRPDTPLPERLDRRLGRQLREEHRELESRFREIHRRALEGDWADLNGAWSELCQLLEAHLEFEEQQLFPAYVAEDPRREEELSVLRREHARLRELMDEIAIEIQLHQLRAHTVDAFIALNHDHASRENRRFYPWTSGYRPTME